MIEDTQTYLEAVRTLATMAGEKIIEIYHSEFSVKHKQDKSPVTEADYAAHEIITAGLNRLSPDIPVLSEEDEVIDFELRKSWHTYWLVDPLDGTREFIKKNGEFTVNIALIENNVAVLGVIYAPVLQMMYYAAEGMGSFKTTSHDQANKIHVAEHCASPVRIAGSRGFHTDEFKTFLGHLPEHTTINMGSALKSCMVAEGSIDIYPRLGLTSEWDTAAAQCIVEEAGGYLVDMQLQPLRYNTRESLLNPHFFVYGDIDVDWQGYL